MKKFFSVLSVTLALFLAWGCCQDETIVIPPEPTPVNPTLEGTVFTNNNAPLVGATVVVTGPKTYTLKTDEKGHYSVQLEPGSYTIVASYSDLTPKDGAFVAESDQNLIWNAFLPTPIVIENDVPKEGIKINVPVPSINSGSAGQQIMTFIFPSGGVAEDDKLVVVYYFDIEYADDKEGQETRLMTLVKAKFYLKSGKPLVEPANIYVPIPAEPVQSLLNGHDQRYTIEDGRLHYNTLETGTIVLNYYITIKETDRWEPEYFYPKMYDNRYGSDRMTVKDPYYMRSVGGNVSGNNTLLTNFALAYTNIFTPMQRLGANFPYEVVLPVGTAVTFTAEQRFINTSFSVAEGLLTAAVNQADEVNVTIYTQNREHTGGSN